jgi:multiple sugar transport system permease protein
MAVRGPFAHQRRVAWWFLAPSLVLYAAYVILPILFTFYLSLTDWDGLSPQVTPLCLSEGAGSCFSNYAELVADEQFWRSLKNTGLWLLFYPLAAVIGLAFALFFHVKGIFVPFYKSLLFSPMVLSLVVVGTIWSWFLQPHFGLAEYLLKAAGILGSNEHVGLMASFDFATFGVILAACWPHAAYCMVLYLAGLSNLQKNVIEAARIDGVSRWQLIWHIILPMLRPATAVVALVTFIGSMRAFDIIMVMTAGGPAGSTHVLASYMYEQTFQSFRYGYGAALSVVLFVLSLVLIVAYLAVVQRTDASGKGGKDAH